MASHNRLALTTPINLAGGFAVVVLYKAITAWPVEPDNLLRIINVYFTTVDFLTLYRKCKAPLFVVAYSLNKVFSDQQGQIELSESTVFALGANKLKDIRVAYIKRGHLRTTSATSRGDGEAHFGVDIHKRQWAGCVGAGTDT